MRRCGDCTLCYKLLPVPVLGKLANERCEHQRATGCRIYADRPGPCRLWSCGWLTGEDCAPLSRPDRSHYVIDPSPEFITVQNNETGEQIHIPVLQIWCDPNYPHAHRDPALRALLDAKPIPALVRFSSREAVTLMPPSLCSDGQWHEVEGGSVGREHSFDEIAAVHSGEA